MLRLLLVGLTLLHLGPGLAFALLAFGCGDAALRPAPLCDGGVAAFLRLTVALWGALALAAWCWAAIRGERAQPHARPARRAAILLALAGSGAIVALTGQWLSGEAAAWLALPAAVATGWLALANPSHCNTPYRVGDERPPT